MWSQQKDCGMSHKKVRELHEWIVLVLWNPEVGVFVALRGKASGDEATEQKSLLEHSSQVLSLTEEQGETRNTIYKLIGPPFGGTVRNNQLARGLAREALLRTGWRPSFWENHQGPPPQGNTWGWWLTQDGLYVRVEFKGPGWLGHANEAVPCMSRFQEEMRPTPEAAGLAAEEALRSRIAREHASTPRDLRAVREMS